MAANLRTALISAMDAGDGGRHAAEDRRVLRRTYVARSPSQEAAAEQLGLPFSTYRRHLSQAVERLIERLWLVELGVARLPIPPSSADSDPPRDQR